MNGWEPFLLGEARALSEWVSDAAVTDLFLNGTQSLYVDRGKGLEAYPSPFTESGLRDFVERLVLPLGRRIDAVQPFLDGLVGEAARFHAVLPPAIQGAPHLSFRFFRSSARVPLESFGVFSFLEDGLQMGQNWILSGSTGSGKTTLLCRLLEKTPSDQRIVVVEESREIQLDHPHVLSLEGRPPGPEGVGEISLRTLLRQALRMGPNRLVLGECRGEEAFDLIQALNTGHRSSLSTLHANSCRDALRRLESLVLLGSRGATLAAAREWVAGAIQGVAYLERRGNERRVSEAIELQGLEGEVYRITPKFSATGVGDGRRGSPLAPGNKVCEFTPFFR